MVVCAVLSIFASSDLAMQSQKTKMDFFCEDLPSTSQLTPKKGPEDSQMREDTDHDSLRGNSSSVRMTVMQEQHSSSGIDDISRRAQELVEKINHSRTSDQNIIDSFQEMLIKKVTEMCRQMKEKMYMVYEENSDNMQVKLQELSEVLGSCSKLSHELLEASTALVSLQEGLAIGQEIES